MHLVTKDLPDHAVLRRPAEKVKFTLDENTQQFIEKFKLFFANLKSPLGKPAGLAATQVGMSLRIVIIQVPPEAKTIRKDVYDALPPTILINPSYEPILDAGENKDWEGCYSVIDKMGEVYRHTAIQYEAFNEDGEKLQGVARGFLARLIQHEVGHLNGELYVDLIQSDCRYGTFDEMIKIRKQEMENR